MPRKTDNNTQTQTHRTQNSGKLSMERKRYAKLYAGELLCFRRLTDIILDLLEVSEVNQSILEIIEDTNDERLLLHKYDKLLDRAGKKGAGYAMKVFLLFHFVSSAKWMLDELLQEEGQGLLMAILPQMSAAEVITDNTII